LPGHKPPQKIKKGRTSAIISFSETSDKNLYLRPTDQV
jgi:hypothetical protein